MLPEPLCLPSHGRLCYLFHLVCPEPPMLPRVTTLPPRHHQYSIPVAKFVVLLIFYLPFLSYCIEIHLPHIFDVNLLYCPVCSLPPKNPHCLEITPQNVKKRLKTKKRSGAHPAPLSRMFFPFTLKTLYWLAVKLEVTCLIPNKVWRESLSSPFTDTFISNLCIVCFPICHGHQSLLSAFWSTREAN